MMLVVTRHFVSNIKTKPQMSFAASPLKNLTYLRGEIFVSFHLI